MKKNIKLIVSISLISLLNGCSNSLDTNVDINLTDTFNEANISPITPLTYSNVEEYDGTIYKDEIGADGEIEEIDGYLEVKSGVNLEIIQVLRDEYLTIINNEDNISMIISSDFIKAEEKISGESSIYGKFNCINSYESHLPIYLSDNEGVDIDDIFYLDDDKLIDSNCPQWLNYIDFYSNMESLSNITIINNNSKVKSHISEYISIKSQDEVYIEPIEPLVPYGITQTKYVNYMVDQLKVGVDGELEINNFDTYDISFITKNSIENMNINTITKEEYLDATIDNDVIKAKIETDFNSATEHMVGVSSLYGDFDCINTYESFLPLNNIHEISFTQMIFDNKDIKFSTCPTWITSIQDFLYLYTEHNSSLFLFDYSTNITITNSNTNNNTNISIEYSLYPNLQNHDDEFADY